MNVPELPEGVERRRWTLFSRLVGPPGMHEAVVEVEPGGPVPKRLERVEVMPVSDLPAIRAAVIEEVRESDEAVFAAQGRAIYLRGPAGEHLDDEEKTRSILDAALSTSPDQGGDADAEQATEVRTQVGADVAEGRVDDIGSPLSASEALTELVATGRTALSEFEDCGDYEAPVEALRKLLAALSTSQPEAGERCAICNDTATKGPFGPEHVHLCDECDRYVREPEDQPVDEDAIKNLIGRAWEVSTALEGHGIEPELRVKLDAALRAVACPDCSTSQEEERQRIREAARDFHPREATEVRTREKLRAKHPALGAETVDIPDATVADFIAAGCTIEQYREEYGGWFTLVPGAQWRAESLRRIFGSTSQVGEGQADVSFSGGPLNETGGFAVCNYAPIHLDLPWERGSYEFAEIENDGEGAWLNYEWKPLGEGEAFPDGPEAFVRLADPVRELRRVWDGRIRALLERAEGGIDADALRLLLDGVDPTPEPQVGEGDAE